MRCLKLVIAYDGSSYHGFQRQINAMTVQQVLEEKLTRIFGETIYVKASGRTDAKVHAFGQVVSFTTKCKIPVENIPKAVNSVLPKSIAVMSVQEVDIDFHARFCAKQKSYIYKIIQSDVPRPFQANYAWLLKEMLDLNKMQQAAEKIIGEHDFSSFQASGSTPTSPVRVITKASWCRKNDNEIEFLVKGNGFLYHMVRNLVGTMVDVGLGKITVLDFESIMLAKDRNVAGKTAPPQGLYLAEVYY